MSLDTNYYDEVSVDVIPFMCIQSVCFGLNEKVPGLYILLLESACSSILEG